MVAEAAEQAGISVPSPRSRKPVQSAGRPAALTLGGPGLGWARSRGLHRHVHRGAQPGRRSQGWRAARERGRGRAAASRAAGPPGAHAARPGGPVRLSTDAEALEAPLRPRLRPAGGRGRRPSGSHAPAPGARRPAQVRPREAGGTSGEDGTPPGPPLQPGTCSHRQPPASSLAPTEVEPLPSSVLRPRAARALRETEAPSGPAGWLWPALLSPF